jgi:hypothetical protein
VARLSISGSVAILARSSWNPMVPLFGERRFGDG